MEYHQRFLIPPEINCALIWNIINYFKKASTPIPDCHQLSFISPEFNSALMWNVINDVKSHLCLIPEHDQLLYTIIRAYVNILEHDQLLIII